MCMSHQLITPEGKQHLMIASPKWFLPYLLLLAGLMLVLAAPRTAVAQGPLYQLRQGGMILRFTGTPCRNGSCPGWEMLGNNPDTVAISSGGAQFYRLDNNGRIWRFTGQVCVGGVCPGWQLLDNNSNVKAITAAGDMIYKLHRNGQIWRYTQSL